MLQKKKSSGRIFRSISWHIPPEEHTSGDTADLNPSCLPQALISLGYIAVQRGVREVSDSQSPEAIPDTHKIAAHSPKIEQI